MSKDIKKASMRHNGIVPQVAGRYLKPPPGTVVGTGPWVLMTWDQGATQKDPKVNPKDKLWEVCRAWATLHKVKSDMDVCDVEQISLALLVEEICEIVGYHKEPDENS